MSGLEQAVAHLKAGEWPEAHAIVQQDETPLGHWAHGIVHLLEGDVDNARYWYRRAGRSWAHAENTREEIIALDRAVKKGAMP